MNKLKKINLMIIALIFMNGVVACDAVKDEIIIDDIGNIADNDYSGWAQTTLSTIDKDFKMPNSSSYYENQNKDQISFVWGNIFLLYTHTEGVKFNQSAWTTTLSNTVANCESYWTTGYKGKDGYATLPIPNGGQPDRFYDENGWMAIGLCDAYSATKNQIYLDKAKEALAFAMSGEDNVLGGGIYFQETFVEYPPQKNAICCAVAMLASLKMYQITNEIQYLDDAQRLNTWVMENLLDKSDNLLWDAKIVADGSINKTKWSYNAGFMIRSWIKLYEITKDETFLTQAKNTMSAAEAKWFNSQTGALNDPGYFAFTLVDSWFDFYDLEKNNTHLTKAFKAINFVHDRLQDPNGRYPDSWGKINTGMLTEWDLRYSTVVAYVYMRGALYKDKYNK